jgi:hypothetical protein
MKFEDELRADSTDEQEEQSRPDLTNCVLFHGVTYIGSTNIFSPRSEEEIHRRMTVLNDENHFSIDVTLCLPDNPDGSVRFVSLPSLDQRDFPLLVFRRLIDPESEIEILSYRVRQILFCTRDSAESSISCCWSFISCHSSNSSSAETLYHSHVFRCSNQDAVSFPSPSAPRTKKVRLDLPNSTKFRQCLSTKEC